MANRIVEIIVEIKGNAVAAFNNLKSAIGGVAESVISVHGLIVGLISGAVVAGIKTLVDAFAEQEAVTTKLNAALRVSGQYTDAASRQLQEMADRMRETTIHSDEEALGVSATFASLARELTTAQLAEAQKLAIGFADATGRSVEGATQLIVRSLTGQGNALKRYGVDLDTSASQQEKFNQIAAKLGPLFAISQASADTLAGRIKQAHNEFNELKETLGNVIVKIFDLKGVAEGARDTFISWKKTVQEHSGQIVAWGKGIVEILKGVFDAIKIVWDFFSLGAMIIFDLGKTFFTVGQLIVDAFGLAGLKVADFFDKIKDKMIDWANDLIIILNKVSPEQIPLFTHGPRLAAESMAEATAAVQADLDALGQANQDIEDRAVNTAANVRETWNGVVAHVKAGAKEIQGAGAAAPVPGSQTAGKGANLGVHETLSDVELLHQVTEEMKQLNAERQAGIITQDQFDARMNAQGLILTALIPRLKDNRAELINLYQALAKIQEVRIDAVLGQTERIKESFREGKIGVKEYDDQMREAIQRMKDMLAAGGQTEQQVRKLTNAIREGEKSLKSIGPQLIQAFGLQRGGGGEAIASANVEIAKMALGLATAFTDAIGQALTAGGNFGKVVEHAVGQAAKAFAKLSIGRALMEVADGFVSLALHKPDDAAKHFTAAKIFGAAAVVMGGVGAAFGGEGGGGGGAGSAAGAAGASASASAANKKGSATITITGGLLDMSNPDQVEALRKAIAELSDRDVTVK